MSHTTLVTLAVLFVVSDSTALVAIVAVVVSTSPSGSVWSGCRVIRTWPQHASSGM
jgi:hypothetical protein